MTLQEQAEDRAARINEFWAHRGVQANARAVHVAYKSNIDADTQRDFYVWEIKSDLTGRKKCEVIS